jgi:hypothetical protein
MINEINKYNKIINSRLFTAKERLKKIVDKIIFNESRINININPFLA